MQFLRRFRADHALRITALLFAAAIVALALVGCNSPRVAGPYTLDHAQQLAAQGKRKEAIQLYDEITRRNSQSNPDLAAQSLYDAGAFSSDPARYGNTESLRQEGESAAWQHWKQLRDEYPAQARRLLNLGQSNDKLVAIGDAIEKHNQNDWKYQIIDFLVRITGRNPVYSYALALIVLGVGVKMLVLPLSMKQYKSQREMQQLMPRIKELQAKYKGTELHTKQMELYKEHGVNPLAGCLPTLLTFPFFILVYQAVREYEPAFSHGTFLWIGSPLSRQFPHIFAGNLATSDIPLLVLYTITMYVVTRMTPAADPAQQQQQNTMALMTSAMFFYMFLNYRWSSAFVLYWLALNVFSIWQTYTYVYKPHRERVRNAPPPPPALTGGDGDGGAASSNGAGQRNGSGAKAAGTAKPAAQSGRAAGATSAPAGKPAGAQAGSQPARVRPRNKKKR